MEVFERSVAGLHIYINRRSVLICKIENNPNNQIWTVYILICDVFSLRVLET